MSRHRPPLPESDVQITASTASPRRDLPLEGFLPPAAARCHHRRCPPGVCLASTFVLPGRTVASPSAPPASNMKPRLQGFTPRGGTYHRPPLPAPDGLSSLGFFPLQGPSTDVQPRLQTGGRRPLSGCCVQDEHNPCASSSAHSKSRARGADSVSTAPIPTRNLHSDDRVVEDAPGAMGRASRRIQRCSRKFLRPAPALPRAETVTDATVARLSAKPWAVSAPEGADLRTVASVSSAAKKQVPRVAG